MPTRSPTEIVKEFNQAINDRDIGSLSSLMTDDHTFIDSSNEVHAGKESMVLGWKEFFTSYPDYRNHFNWMESRKDQVFIIGHSTCTYDPLDGPAIWTAKVADNRVKEWRVYLDTPAIRKKLNLPGALK
jgi:ketosteroid isomerase-like protein